MEGFFGVVIERLRKIRIREMVSRHINLLTRYKSDEIE